jgi:hypothetical protein
VRRGPSFSIIAALAAFAAVVRAGAATPTGEDRDWPCQQRLVPKLAAATYWNGPSLDDLGNWRDDPEVADLVQRLAPRRVSTHEGVSAIAKFATAASGDRSRRLALVFRGLLDETEREREGLIAQLKEIGRRQRELADLAGRLLAELNSVPPDAVGEAAARRNDLQQRHDFTVRNFEEIQRTIRYACEAPVELDARLGAWSRALQEAASP